MKHAYCREPGSSLPMTSKVVLGRLGEPCEKDGRKVKAILCGTQTRIDQILRHAGITHRIRIALLKVLSAQQVKRMACVLKNNGFESLNGVTLAAWDEGLKREFDLFDEGGLLDSRVRKNCRLEKVQEEHGVWRRIVNSRGLHIPVVSENGQNYAGTESMLYRFSS